MTTEDIDKKIEQISKMGRQEIESTSRAISFSPLPTDAKKALQKAVDERLKQLPSISPEAVTSEMTYD